MRYPLALAAVTSLGMASVTASGAMACHPVSADSLTIRGIEDRMGTCMRSQDARCLDSLFAPEWTVRWADGSRQTKSEYLASVAQHKDSYESVTTDSLSLSVFGDAAVVTGIDTERSTFSGKKGSGRYAWLDVFARRRGRWQIVASQSTKLP